MFPLPDTQNGIGGSLFSNDAGVLMLDKMIVGKVTAAGLVSTSNGGVTMMTSSMISKSTIDVSRTLNPSGCEPFPHINGIILTNPIVGFDRLSPRPQWEVP